MRTLVTRARALCLLLALLGGSFGFPLYDAVAYHARVLPVSSEAKRLGKTSSLWNHEVTAQSHSATCALGLITLAGRGSPALGTGSVLATARTESSLLLPPPLAPELIRFSSTRSRAPPAVTA